MYVGIWILIPVCWMDTLTSHPDYLNINADSKTIFDIMPATISDFVALRPRDNTGYTFAWSPDTAEPPAPVFVDADGDGLTTHGVSRKLLEPLRSVRIYYCLRTVDRSQSVQNTPRRSR